MRRLKDDIGIVQDRTAERNIEVSEGDVISLTKKQEANKFIDLDTLWISLNNGNFPMFVCFKLSAPFTEEQLTSGYCFRKLIVLSGANADGKAQQDNCSSFEVNINRINQELDYIELGDVGNEGTGIARDIHIYYAYTPMRQEYLTTL